MSDVRENVYRALYNSMSAKDLPLKLSFEGQSTAEVAVRLEQCAKALLQGLEALEERLPAAAR